MKLLIPLFCTVATATAAYGAQSITGIVKDEAGDPVAGATISTTGEGLSVTDLDGKFEVKGVNPADTITVEAVGYEPATAVVKPDVDEYNVTLSSTSSELDEVIVVGYATQRKVNLTGAVAAVRASDLEDRPVTNVTNALAGLAPGLTVSNSGGKYPWL